MSQGLKSAVLLVIDVQVGSIKPHLENLPGEIAALVLDWTTDGGDVRFFRFVNYPGSPCEEFLDWSEMQSGEEIELCPQLRKHAAQIFTKASYSALIPEFQRELDEKAWKTVVLCGIDTAACIQKTALDLFERGIRPFVIAELCGSGGGEEIHLAALQALRRSIGERQVGNRDEALALSEV